MARYLSASWLAAAQAAVSAAVTGWSVPDTAAVGITQVVKGGPDGTVVYHLSSHPTEDGRHSMPRLAPGAADPEDLRFHTTWPVAVAVARGEASAQRAFVDGDIVVTGDAAAVVGAQQLLTLVDAALAELRSTTTYPDPEPPRR